MKGCRPLSDQEFKDVLSKLPRLRDQALFILGCKSGFRISELLSITIQDVYQNGKIVDRISVARSNMKGKKSGRTILLHPEAKSILMLLIQERKYYKPEDFIFESRKGGSISRVQAYRVLVDGYKLIGLTGKLGSHSMRKTFANKMYDKLDHDLIKTQKALGHVSVNSTVSYLSFREEDIDDAILGI